MPTVRIFATPSLGNKPNRNSSSGYSGPSLKQKKAVKNVIRKRDIKKAQDLGFQIRVGNNKSSLRYAGVAALEFLRGYDIDQSIISRASSAGIIPNVLPEGTTVNVKKLEYKSVQGGSSAYFAQRTVKPTSPADIRKAKINLLNEELRKKGITRQLWDSSGKYIPREEGFVINTPTKLRDIPKARQKLRQYHEIRKIERAFIDDPKTRKEFGEQEDAEFMKVERQFKGQKKIIKQRQLQEFENRNSSPFIEGGPTAPRANVYVPIARGRGVQRRGRRNNINLSVKAPRNARFNSRFDTGRFF